ncbi:MAG: nucleoside-diphosphate sugar epimerase/dehydratase [Holdemanella sp.]|uniref:polysaccharide biosynthesis protein n=1 Tax=Holdemanella sp. TaxID=1971762 RepID=UPI002E76E5EE|nr:nucleoside-diphosphate sugar epimerase/dehydratase [Holdemanella sp.]MEE0079802.1 nucleoside-diphosphate sugar epimerase/dehydratase [Holdemanella sp.]
MSKNLKKSNTRWPLVVYDVIVYIIASILLLWIYGGNGNLTNAGSFQLSILGFICIFICRRIGNIYGQIWRYGGIQGYIRLIITDAIAFILLIILQATLSIERMSFDRALSLVCVNLLGAISIRMIYRYAYLYSNNETSKGKFLSKLLYRFSGLTTGTDKEVQKIKIAIIGAGRVGASFAEELVNDEKAVYVPRCFIDIDKTKAGREVNGIPVWYADETTLDKLKAYEVQEIVFAIPNMDVNKKKCLYDHYKNAGYKVKVYDYPTLYTAGSKRNLREFDIEELLFRKPLAVTNEQTYAYYKDKIILITGGGGSIGSELCRQLAKMDPKQIIILDIYENGAYDVQQELKIAYGNNINLQIEICSITHKKALEKVFKQYHPQIIINAAAHKHVPLMEHNCVEAIYNNVFGTKNLIELCEKYNAQRFMMVSTDKAVNPTNVMGATKRMCEMMVQSASLYGHVKYSATRFGNVLGSAGSVIPLFKRQIAKGGPVTLTDKRIIRYFMTMPEASQLVLQSGAMANNGELFVLDMGQPVKILDLAENMIKLSGAHDIEIIETGLRPGEKLYEELLMNSDTLTKTDNDLIFIEKDTPLSKEEIDEKLEVLRNAIESEDDNDAREALRSVVPTFRRPEEINKQVESI